MRKKIWIFFSVITVAIVCLLGAFGCSDEGVKEKKVKDIIRVRSIVYGWGSSLPGMMIDLNFEDATFLCKAEKGSFAYYSEVKQIQENSGETIFYCPYYLLDKDYNFVEVQEDWLDILIIQQEEIVGYCVIKIRHFSFGNWYAQRVSSNLFIGDDGNLISVSEEYVQGRIEEIHQCYDAYDDEFYDTEYDKLMEIYFKYRRRVI